MIDWLEKGRRRRWVAPEEKASLRNERFETQVQSDYAHSEPRERRRHGYRYEYCILIPPFVKYPWFLSYLTCPIEFRTTEP
jgi:hypothetical protein